MPRIRFSRLVICLSGLLLTSFHTAAQSDFLIELLDHLGHEDLRPPEYWDHLVVLAGQAADQAGWLPQMSLSADFPGLTRQIEPILQDDGSQQFVSRSQSYMGANVRVRQQIPWTGGEIVLRSGLYRVQNFAPWQGVSWQSLPVLVSINQPIGQGRPLIRQQEERSLEEQLAGRRLDLAQRQQLADFATDWLLREQRARIWEYALRTMERQDSLHAHTLHLYREGMVSMEDKMSGDIRRAASRQAADRAWIAYQAADARFRLRWAGPESISVEMPSQPPPEMGFAETDLSRLLAVHPDLMEVEVHIRRLEWNLQDSKQQGRPRVYLTAGVGLNQSGVSFAESYQSPAGSQYLTASLEYPLYDWGKNRQEQAALTASIRAEASRRDQRQQSLLAEASVAFIRLEGLRSVWVQSLERIRQAESSCEWLRKQFFEGQILPRQLFLAHEELDRLRQEHLQILTEMWMIWLRLQILDATWISSLSAHSP